MRAPYLWCNKTMKTMERKQINIGDRVVRSKGDYVVGRTGVVVNTQMHRRQVAWDGENTTWVAMDALELEATPYRIQHFTDADRNPKTGRMPYPKYIKL